MILPQPPLDSEKYKYINPNGFVFAISGLFLLLGFSVSIYFFIIKSILLLPYIIFCVIYFLNISFSTFGSFFAEPFDIEKHNKIKEENKDFKPTIDIFLPNCGEELFILANTFKGVKNINYDNKTVYVLDDMNREPVKILSDLFDFKYIAREGNELKKAGNMRNAFNQSTGEFILVFDADFVPRSDFLQETVPYLANTKLGILQTPQYFQYD